MWRRGGIELLVRRGGGKGRNGGQSEFGGQASMGVVAVFPGGVTMRECMLERGEPFA